eukprot:1160650-Pelagomonas_calceolata.AAC.11
MAYRCMKIWRHGVWMHESMEAWSMVAIKYGSMEYGCIKIWKHGVWMYGCMKIRRHGAWMREFIEAWYMAMLGVQAGLRMTC